MKEVKEKKFDFLTEYLIYSFHHRHLMKGKYSDYTIRA